MKNLQALKTIVNSLEQLINENVFEFGAQIREVVQGQEFSNLYKQVKAGIEVNEDNQEIKNELITVLNKSTAFNNFVYEFETLEILDDRIKNYDPTDFFGDHEVFGEMVGNCEFFNNSIYPQYKNIEGVNKAFEALSKKYIELAKRANPISEALENSKSVLANKF